MKVKDFFIILLIIDILTVVFCFPAGTQYLIMPSLLFSGFCGGIYVAYLRKEPIISCFYDGFIVGIPISITQGAIASLLLWYYQGMRFQPIDPFRFILLIFGAAIAFSGIVGVPFGSLLTGLFYHYFRRNKRELDLYESLIEEKSQKKKN